MLILRKVSIRGFKNFVEKWDEKIVCIVRGLLWRVQDSTDHKVPFEMPMLGFTTAVAGVTRPLERLRGPMGPRVQASGYTEQELCFVLRSDCTTASASCLAAVSGRLLLTDQSYQSSPSMTGGTLQRAHCRASSLDVAKSLTVTGLESYCFYEGGVW